MAVIDYNRCFLASVHHNPKVQHNHCMIIQSMLNLKVIKPKQTQTKKLLDIIGNHRILSLHHFDAN